MLLLKIWSFINIVVITFNETFNLYNKLLKKLLSLKYDSKKYTENYQIKMYFTWIKDKVSIYNL